MPSHFDSSRIYRVSLPVEEKGHRQGFWRILDVQAHSYYRLTRQGAVLRCMEDTRRFTLSKETRPIFKVCKNPLSWLCDRFR